MIPIIPLAGATILGGGYALFKRRSVTRMHGVMTPKRERVYQAALDTLKKPASLRKMAAAFRGEGLNEQADLLDKRAALKELPEPIRLARRKVVKQALQCKDPKKVQVVAEAFDSVGANGAAALLRQYAAGLAPSFEPVKNVKRRRRTTEENAMAVNPHLPQDIPGRIDNPEQPAAPQPAPDVEREQPAESPAGEPSSVNPENPAVNMAGEGDGDGPHLNVEVTEPAAPGEPAVVEVETDDPENTEVEVEDDGDDDDDADADDDDDDDDDEDDDADDDDEEDSAEEEF